MKRFLVFLLALASLFGCTTVTQRYAGNYGADEVFEHAPLAFSNSDVSASLAFDRGEWVNLEITNQTAQVLSLITDLSSFNRTTGETSRLVPEGSKFTNAAESHPNLVVPPKGKIVKPFVAADSIHWDSGAEATVDKFSLAFTPGRPARWIIDAWVPDALQGSTFVFGYRLGNEDRFIVFEGKPEDAKKGPEFLGRVSVRRTFWNIAFSPAVATRRQLLLDQAKAEAKKQYGEGVTLLEPSYDGKWSPLSLILGVSLLGFVEDAEFVANVYR